MPTPARSGYGLIAAPPVVKRTVPEPRSSIGPITAVAAATATMTIDTSLQRRGIDDEAVADVRAEHPLPRLVDLVGGDDLDLGGDAVLGAEVEHLLGLADRADGRPGERAALHDQREDRDAQWL